MTPASAASENTLNRAATGYRATLVSQGVRLACKIVGVVTLARLVSPAEHGVFAMAASVMFFLTLFRDLGLSAAAIQSPVLSAGQMNALFRLHVLAGVALCAAMLLVSPAAAEFFHEPRLQPVLCTMSVGFLLIGGSGWPRTLLARELRFTELNRVETAGAVLGTIAMIAAGNTGAYAFVAFLLVSEAVMLAAAWRYAHWRPREPADWGGLRALMPTGAHLLAYNLALYVLQQADAVLMGRWFGPRALGPYNRAGQILIQPATHLAAPFTQVLLSTLSRLGPDAPEFPAHFRATTNAIAHFTLPLAVMCLILPGEMVRVVLGANWPDAVPLLAWLAVSAALSFLSSTVYALCVASGKPDRLTWMTLLALPVTLAGLVLGRPHGPVGLAAGLAAANAVLFFPRLWWSTRGTRVTPSDYARALAGPLGVAIAFAAGLVAGRMMMVDRAVVIRLLTSIGAGVGGVAVLALVWPRVRGEFRALWEHLPLRRGAT